LHRFLCTTKGDESHGCKVREESAGQSREGNARTEARHAQKRRFGQEGDQPQTSDCDRLVRSAKGRRQGAVEEIILKEVFVEEVEHEEVFIEEVHFEEIEHKEVVVEKVFIEEVGEEEVRIYLRASADEIDPQMAQMYSD
jgi:hypothetical protein